MVRVAKSGNPGDGDAGGDDEREREQADDEVQQRGDRDRLSCLREDADD